MTNIWLGDVERVRQASLEVLKFAEEKSLALWGAWGRIYLGWALFQEDPRTGLDELMPGLEVARQIGACRMEAFHLGLAAEMHSKLGRHDDAGDLFSKAFSALSESGDLPFTADLLRLRALASLRQASDNADQAQQDLLKALDIARDQKSLSLELRAGCDLAELWAGAGERRKAQELLSPIRARFSEGAAMPDLQKADALLLELQ